MKTTAEAVVFFPLEGTVRGMHNCEEWNSLESRTAVRRLAFPVRACGDLPRVAAAAAATVFTIVYCLHSSRPGSRKPGK
jgi:hypothetical protein